MDLTLDPALFDGIIETEEEWGQALDRLNTDAEFRDLIGRLFREGISPNDLYGAPLWIPEEWTERRDGLEPGTKISVTAAGQVEGYFFEWGECVIRGGGPGDCWTPPSSPSGYEPFHQSDMQVMTAAGEQVIRPGGMIGIGGHAPQNASFAQAVRHYQFPERGRMIGRLYENGIGGYFRGGLLPQATFADVALIRASALSGHWEYRDRIHTSAGRVVEGYDCLGPCMVGSPGLPLTRETRYRGSGEMITASARDGSHKRWPRRITSSIALDEDAASMGYAAGERPLIEENDEMMKLTLSDGRVLEERADGSFAPVAACAGGCSDNKDAEPCSTCSNVERETQTAAVSDEAFAEATARLDSLEGKLAELSEMVMGSQMDAAAEGSLDLAD